MRGAGWKPNQSLHIPELQYCDIGGPGTLYLVINYKYEYHRLYKSSSKRSGEDTLSNQPIDPLIK